MSTHPNNTLNSGDITDLFAQGLDGISRSIDKHQYSGAGTTKLFGLFEIDSMVAGVVEGFWQQMAKHVSTTFSPKAYGTIQKYGKQLWESSAKAPLTAGQTTALNRAAAGTTLAINLGIKLAPMAGQMRDNFKRQREERDAVARKLAPVLDDLVGSHSRGALNKACKQNDVLAVYANRMHKENHINNFYDVLKASVIIPNLLEEGTNFEALRSGQNLEDVHNARIAQQQAEATAGGEPAFGKGKLFDFKGMSHLVTGSNFSLPQIIDKVKGKKLKHLYETRQPICAGEMILELHEQLDAKPDSYSFKMPGQRGGQYPLEEYVMRVLIQHQKDMADLKPEYSEIRDALKEDLIEVVKPIAEALRNGELSALSLIRLVGEGSIIKNKGRALADPDVVGELIQKHAGKAFASVQPEPKEYFANATFTEKDFITAIQTLEGDDRFSLCILMPEWLLKKAGLDDKELKEVKQFSATHLGPVVTAMVSAMNEKSDQELKQENMTHSNVRHIRKAQAAIEENGEKAVKKLRANASNPEGIEQLIANWAVPQILDKKIHLGTLLKRDLTAEKDAPEEEEKPSRAASAHDRSSSARRKEHAPRSSTHRGQEEARRRAATESGRDRDFSA